MSRSDDPLEWLERHDGHANGTRTAFDQQLHGIDRALVDVGTLVADRIGPVTTAFLAGDAADAATAVTADATVDRGCLALEERCLELLVRQAPVAGDLRHVVAVLRSVGDIARAGDLLSHIARALTWVHPPSTHAEVQRRIAALGNASARIFTAALEAWAIHDALAAVELQHVDDDVDRQQKSLLTELYSGGHSVEEAVSLALVCRYYERIADHGVEIARQVAYFVTGERPM